MKLRLQSNSIRFRLKQKEVRGLAEMGRVEEMVVIGGEWGGTFSYTLESSPNVETPEANLLKSGVVVRLPREAVMKWAMGDDVGIEARIPVTGNKELHLIIEKDFACLNGPPEQNIDTFPNPDAGKTC